jgi:hypothetical protein
MNSEKCVEFYFGTNGDVAIDYPFVLCRVTENSLKQWDALKNLCIEHKLDAVKSPYPISTIDSVSLIRHHAEIVSSGYVKFRAENEFNNYSVESTAIDLERIRKMFESSDGEPQYWGTDAQAVQNALERELGESHDEDYDSDDRYNADLG